MRSHHYQYLSGDSRFDVEMRSLEMCSRNDSRPSINGQTLHDCTVPVLYCTDKRPNETHLQLANNVRKRRARMDDPAMNATSAKFLRERVVVAPMVRGSELAFRMLLRHLYGPITCYSPMMTAETIQDTSETNLFRRDHLSDGDAPLVVQICGNDPRTLREACSTILKEYQHVSGIDFNLGCPQTCAEFGKYGAFLVENEPETALECVRTMKDTIQGTARLSCKIRLLEDLEQTINFAKKLEQAGCDCLAVHCRKRTAKFDGKADLNAGKQVVEALDIPVILNGADITSIEDVKAVLEQTGCTQVMVARPILANPYLFHPESPPPQEMASRYLQFVQKYPVVDHRYLHLHIRWFFRSDCQPPQENAFDPSNWKHRLWNFLHRPYLVQFEQWRDVVMLYCMLGGYDQPEDFKNLPVPTFQTIRAFGKVEQLKRKRKLQTVAS